MAQVVKTLFRPVIRVFVLRFDPETIDSRPRSETAAGWRRREIDRRRGLVAKRLVWALPVIQAHIAGDAMARRARAVVVVQIHLLILSERQKRSVKMLSSARPLPSRLIRTPAASRRWVYCGLVK